ncbi:hypothetical protein K474DRAFT_1601263 [Panus rudis PR-1116 ss-1]|nr:hypothetical protein K474DRAFT_1601263 [Panus rudis PR-1116 ss-1]
MDINSSTNDGQAQILQNLFAQANIGDPTDHQDVQDIREHVVLVHGDLGTGERLQGSKRSRSIETKEVRRLQPALYVFGLFHLLMACADAIWKMYIEPKELRKDPNSLYQHACRIRPHESNRIGSKPGFRLVHDLIHQFATARMLDIWRAKVQHRTPSHTSLKIFAASKPSWEFIVDLSFHLARHYITDSDSKSRWHASDGQVKDELFQNNSLMLARLLLYVELAHAMKHGDIGRVEATFLRWALIFKTVSKHKYSAVLIKTMNDFKYNYPPRLARAIRLNWLCNPTGRPDGFRAVDWLVELMNLYTKVIYGSTGSTRTFELVLKQSPLIELFRHVHRLMQDNLHVLHRTVRHARPDLRSTIQVLRNLLEESKAHERVPHRSNIKALFVTLVSMPVVETDTL